INTREHFTVLDLVGKHFEVSNPWFNGSVPITVYQLDELLGTKLRALYQRKKGRDLFDLATAISQPNANTIRIVDCFHRYMEHGETPVTRAQFEANLAAKAKDRAFIEDIGPILAPGINWDFETALMQVSEKLVAKLPGEPWKGLAKE
ncbi:MAG: nucleotidyl transferase AbiEii/AbiGii toxin family protein, partial [Proteobacteria bacterium]|nr:nucleotidyl transferase AbiEii/AbiGii toxin family protein [Pseudomonadota bacterium]